MSKCTILAHVRNSNGEIVESRLYKDLLHYTSNNRELTKEYYAVGTNEEFLERVKDTAEFDENGEITFKSLKRLAKLHVKEDTLIDVLNKDLGSGEMSYDKAIGKISYFNRGSVYKDSYMATIKPTKDGNYTVSVVNKTKENQRLLEETIANQTIQDRIKYYLAKAGVSVSFMDKEEGINGKYSTKNATKTADGLYKLIKIARGVTDVESSIAEEAGHFVVASLGDNPLVTRLTSLLDPDVQKNIFGENYDDKYLGENSRKETAGYLVGMALINQLEYKNPWQKLAYRIANIAKRIYATISFNDVLKSTLDAQHIAENIAKGFISNDFDGTVETALQTEETLYDATKSTNVKVFEDTVKVLKLQAEEMKAISNKMFKKFKALVGQVTSGRENLVGAFSDVMAVDGIAEAVVLLTDCMREEIPSLLSSIDYSNTSTFYLDMPKNAKALRTVRIFLTNAYMIEKTINDNLSTDRKDSLIGVENIDITNSDGTIESYNLRELHSTLRSLISKMEGILQEKEKTFFLKFLTTSYGEEYIKRSSRVVFNMKRGEKLLKFIQERPEGVSIADYLSTLENDITLYERFMASMSNSSDIIGQIIDSVAKEADKRARDKTREDFIRLQELESRYKKLKKEGFIKDRRDIYEVDENGKLTGNFNSEYLYYKWEEEYEKLRREEEKKFFDAHPELENASSFKRGLMFDAYFSPISAKWHKLNSRFIIDPYTDKGRYIPNKNYTNPSWKGLSKEARVLISDIRYLKADIDSRLGEVHTTSYRAPQFRDNIIGKIRNRRLYEGLGKAVTHQICASIRDTFCETSEDYDYGSNATYNSRNEMSLDSEAEKDLLFEKERLNRLPLYGINKLKNTGELSTYFFGSMLSYSIMANQYMTKNVIVDTLEVGKEVLLERKVAGIKTEKLRHERSRAFTRYTKYLEKQLYNVSMPKQHLGRHILLNKLVGLLSSLSSYMFLAGNVQSGITNLGTGSIEIFKEVMAGEHFGPEEWMKANALYMKHLMPNLLSSISHDTALWKEGEIIKDDKLALFIRYFDAMSDTVNDFRGGAANQSRVVNFFGKCWWYPFKSGEFYMSGMPYLMLALNTKLYNLSGEEVNLWDAYAPTSLSENKEVKKDLKLIEEVFIKNKKDIPLYNMLKDMLNQYENMENSSSIFGATLNFDAEQLEYIRSHNYNMADTANTKASIQDDIDRIVWTAADEAAFENKAGEIRNRMHGIYNHSDSVAIQQTLYGNMLLVMKGYALGMMEKRFGASKYNIALKNETGGYLLDSMKMIIYPFAKSEWGNIDWKAFGLAIKAVFFPFFGENTKKEVIDAGFSEHQFINMRRSLVDGLVIITLTLLKMLTARPDDDDEDDKTQDESKYDIKGIAYYFINRLKAEQETFNTARGFVGEVFSLFELKPIGVSAAENLIEVLYLLAGQNFIDEVPEDKKGKRLTGEDKPDNYTDFFYNSKKEGIYDYGDSKGEKKLLKLIPYYKSKYVFEHPYEAASSFDYGKNVRN